MTKDEDFKLLRIQTCVLKVNIHCDGCKQKVKKLLQRIEGVYQVNIDADQQKVTVSGSVGSATLIKKLIKAGKHAELWSQKGNNNQKPNENKKQKSNCSGDDKKNKGQKQQGGLIKELEALKNKEHKVHGFGLEDDEDYCSEDEFDEDEEEGDQLRFLLRQAAMDANNARKSGVGAISAAASNNGKMNNNGGGKKGNPNQNMGIDPKAMAALKLNPHLGVGNVNLGEARRANDMNSLMGLAGFHGNRSISNSESLGGGGGGFQIQPNSGFQFQPSSNSGFPSGGLHLATGHQPSAAMMNTNGFQQFNNNNNNHHPSALMVRNGHGFQQQQIPQMMYQRSPYIPPSTGYYCNSNYSSLPYPYYYTQQPNYGTHSDQSSASHMFSDENTSSCSIM